MISPMPLAFKASALLTKPGRCLAEQVLVKALGRPNRATNLAPKRSSDEIAVGPSAPMTKSSKLGTRTPMLMVIGLLP